MKKTNRIRVGQADFAVLTRDDAEDEMAAISSLTLERNATQILLDEEINQARERFGKMVAECESQITTKSERLREWAELNPDEFPKGKKSLELAHGTLGFRTGTPKLKTIGRKTWAAVLETIKRTRMLDWVRLEESVNKEKIIADARGAQDSEFPRSIIEGRLRTAGLQVVQDETFFIEPKLEELKNKITEAA